MAKKKSIYDRLRACPHIVVRHRDGDQEHRVHCSGETDGDVYGEAQQALWDMRRDASMDTYTWMEGRDAKGKVVVRVEDQGTYVPSCKELPKDPFKGKDLTLAGEARILEDTTWEWEYPDGTYSFTGEPYPTDKLKKRQLEDLQSTVKDLEKLTGALEEASWNCAAIGGLDVQLKRLEDVKKILEKGAKAYEEKIGKMEHEISVELEWEPWKH